MTAQAAALNKAALTERLFVVQFMVLYQLLLSFMFNISFFLDGSQPNLRQVTSDPVHRFCAVLVCFILLVRLTLAD